MKLFMTRTRWIGAGTGFVLWWLAVSPALADELPKPQSTHPGNIFLAGEPVHVTLPDDDGDWRLLDYEGQQLGVFRGEGRPVEAGQLSVGFYRFRRGDDGPWISLGVLEPLRAVTPPSSPIGVDVAMAWFYNPDRMEAVASLCALAGMRWVRDRLNWAEMEPTRGQFGAPNRYDASAHAQAAAGLQVLQVIHYTPAWGNPETKRFPLDLRDAHRFFRTMAQRWRGQVMAFEPWNEADISVFGGHVGSEMASFQKAAYLGLKAGNPDMVVCQNVFAHHNTNQLADLADNETWPYFETFNLHHYEPLANFPRLYADYRAVSAGRPLWVTECAMPVKWEDEALKEPSEADLKVQAERVGQTFAASLHEGSRATFYFLLPHYVEKTTQFGIIRPDLTPRPAYVALAAVGRWLADARALGRLSGVGEDVHAYLFRARPDGREHDVLVAWTRSGSSDLVLPVSVEQAIDHLGRPHPLGDSLSLTTAPLYLILPKRAGDGLPTTPAPIPPPFRNGQPCPVVLQAIWPATELDLEKSALKVPAEHEVVSLEVYAYNFARHTMQGTLTVQEAEGWRVTLPSSDISLEPGERQEWKVHLQREESDSDGLGRVTLAVRFPDEGEPGRAVLSVRTRIVP